MPFDDIVNRLQSLSNDSDQDVRLAARVFLARLEVTRR